MSITTLTLRQPSSRFVQATATSMRSGTLDQLIAERPEALQTPSLLVELVYEDYCQRRDEGESVDPSHYFKRFPSIREPLKKLLVIDDLVERGTLDLPWQPATEPSFPKEGAELFGCRLDALIGRGAFSRVFRATQLQMGNREVALKVSLAPVRDAAILGRLDHESVVRVYSVHQNDQSGLHGVAMELIDGCTLSTLAVSTRDERSAAVPMVSSWTTEFAADLCDARSDAGERMMVKLIEGVEYLFTSGVFHEDLKPENVLVDREGHPKIVDFNLAAESSRAITATGGTLAYMAPEQLVELAESQAIRVSPQTELYALAAMLIKHFTSGSTAAASPDSSERTARRLLKERDESFWASRISELPAGWRQPLRDATRDDPSKRLPNVCVFGDAIRKQLRQWKLSRRAVLAAVG